MYTSLLINIHHHICLILYVYTYTHVCIIILLIIFASSCSRDYHDEELYEYIHTSLIRHIGLTDMRSLL